MTRELTELEKEFMTSFPEGLEKVKKAMSEYRTITRQKEEEIRILSDQYGIPVSFSSDYGYIPKKFVDLEHLKNGGEDTEDFDDWPEELKKFGENYYDDLQVPYYLTEHYGYLEPGFWQNSHC